MSAWTKLRNTVENVTAAPFTLTGLPVQKLTATGAQQSTLGGVLDTTQKASLAVGTGVAATVLAGPVAGAAGLSAANKLWSGPAPAPDQTAGLTDYYVDTSPNTSTVATGGDVGEKSNSNSIASLVGGITKALGAVGVAGAAVNAGGRRVNSPSPTTGNMIAAPNASGPLVVPVQQGGGLPGGMLLPIAALALIAFKILL